MQRQLFTALHIVQYFFNNSMIFVTYDIIFLTIYVENIITGKRAAEIELTTEENLD